ncbi:hypothetical protein LMG28688_00810 [Paraburkholderia caffeinitolerans]|uniref:Zinc finger/thioredoxin putative domain-containing protein n=1 Tax=Paraburkholderia caffeinitolerans TaxID=1723730 RepID=A0A6J5FK25_9BURK|nr:hypothetical protein LMG28688_00810 [Paraburkholderia caffeinitolerans]
MNWLCIRCRHEFPFYPEKIGIDDFGIYVFCPHCGRRNQLINVGKRGRIALQQTGK